MHELLAPLRERLLAAGVAPRHVRRYITELQDHAADLATAEMARGWSQDQAEARAVARLGTLTDLTHAMAARREFRSWGARAPWAVYGLGAVLGLLIPYVLGVFALAGIIEAHQPAPDIHPVLPTWFETAFEGVSYGTSLLLPLALGAVYAVMATRQRMTALWPSVALLIIGIVGATGTWSFDPGNGQAGSLALGLSFGLIPPFPSLETSIRHMAINLLLTLAPYLAWHVWQKAVARYAADARPPDDVHLIGT
ncbi:MAG: hypothetical protein PW843_04730 [Azospirillaceae bacterium]|nr:hypothetical protein [Azospirillaceae bacterium]